MSDLPSPETNLSPNALTALDWIALVLAVGLTAGLELFPFLVAPRYAAMFDAFGAGPLPALTQLSLSRWFPIVLALAPLAGIGAALVERQTIGRRRALIVVSFFASLVALGICVVGLYLPLFALAGDIAAD